MRPHQRFVLSLATAALPRQTPQNAEEAQRICRSLRFLAFSAIVIPEDADMKPAGLVNQ